MCAETEVHPNVALICLTVFVCYCLNVCIAIWDSYNRTKMIGLIAAPFTAYIQQQLIEIQNRNREREHIAEMVLAAPLHDREDNHAHLDRYEREEEEEHEQIEIPVEVDLPIREN